MSVVEIGPLRNLRRHRALAGAMPPRTAAARISMAIEIAAVYGCILLYIWKWHKPHPLLWIPILAFIILTHFFRGDTLETMGLLAREARESARIILIPAVAVYWALLIWSVEAHHLTMPWPHDVAVSRAAIYAAWCCFQQYLMQSYFFRRLRAVFHSPHLSAAAAALMFAGAHVPNLLLMAATLVGGFILSEVFARHANIWPLALVQFAGGLLIAAVAPVSITHQMRVGPGYYTWRPTKGFAR